MGYQVNVRLSEEMKQRAEEYAKEYGFSNIQEVIKNSLRKELYENYSLDDIKKIEEFESFCDEYNLYASEEELFESLKK
ncbi:MAG: hypothetical protein LAT82_02760 [Nanoarchaeota archaeon]|nr:hypothetical protein [Nanoarchaeota archaeon]